MTTFKIGDKVVCIVNFDSPQCNPVTVLPQKNKIYTIRAFNKTAIYLKEIVNPRVICKDGFNEQCFASNGFRPLIKNAISDLIETFKEIKETSDYPIKELV